MGKSQTPHESWGPTFSRDVFILVAGVSVLLLCAAFLIVDWPAIGKWMDKPNSPAWVQAWGSILAIVAAMGIAAYQRFDERRSRREAQFDERRSRREAQLAMVEIHKTAMKNFISDAALVAADIRDTWNFRASDDDPETYAKQFAARIQAVPFPTDEQLLCFSAIWPVATEKIAHNRAWMREVERKLSNWCDRAVQGEKISSGHVQVMVVWLSDVGKELHEAETEIFHGKRF